MAYGRTFLLGEQFTVADAYLFTILNWSDLAKVDLGAFAQVRAFLARVGARPAVREALRVEALRAAR